jgi:hypothetical protein
MKKIASAHRFTCGTVKGAVAKMNSTPQYWNQRFIAVSFSSSTPSPMAALIRM